MRKSRLIGSLVLATLTSWFFWKNQQRPKYLGLGENHQLAPMPRSPNAVSSQTDQPSHYVPPIPFTGSASEARDTLMTSLTSMPGCQLVTIKPNYIHATFTSQFWHFIDDVELFIDAPQHLIQFRSQSRVGYSDFGVNRQRYQHLVETFSRLQSTTH